MQKAKLNVFYKKGHYKMDSINRKAEKNNNNIQKVSVRLQTVFTDPEEVELVKKVAGGNGKISGFLRRAAVKEAKILIKSSSTTSLS